MNEAIEKLKEIGVETIHQKTHVSIKSLEDIINQRFDAIHHIQFNGFLNIIENELHIDMTPVRNALKDYRLKSGQESDERKLFIESPKEVASKLPLFVVLIAIVAVIFFFLFISEDEKNVSEYHDAVQSSAVEDAKQHLESQDATAVTNFQGNVAVPTAPQTFQVPVVTPKKLQNEAHPFVIYPKESLWIGVINIDTDVQKDTITSEPYPLDETSNLLITLGHGHFKIDLNGKVENLADRGRVRYHYKNGKLSRISAKEFKELNKGKAW